MNEFICGIDEAGRGALAGPVYAAAVILPDSFDVSVLNDSKKLSPKKREAARKYILKNALCYHTAFSTPELIDSINILQATLQAMKTAFEAVWMQWNKKMNGTGGSLTVIVDGNQLPPIREAQCSFIAEPKADTRYPAVMAASILAKTERDACMCAYHEQYPQYRYDLHKGYGTALHAARIREYGSSPIQRHSFIIKRAAETP